MRPPRTPQQRRSADAAQRQRVLGGLTAALRSSSFADTTVADVVREARVSRTTFYAHFTDLDDAFLALYEQGAEQVLAVIAEEDARAAAASLDWFGRVEVVAGAYFRTLAAGAGVSASLLGEVASAGDRAQVVRREVLDRYVDLFDRLAEEVVAGDPALHRPSRTVLLAAVGGMHELILRAVDDEGTAHLEDLVAATTDLVAAVLHAPA